MKILNALILKGFENTRVYRINLKIYAKISKSVDYVCIRIDYLQLTTFLPFLLANSSQYAHYVFTTLDQSKSGFLHFEVRLYSIF